MGANVVELTSLTDGVSECRPRKIPQAAWHNVILIVLIIIFVTSIIIGYSLVVIFRVRNILVSIVAVKISSLPFPYQGY